MKAMPLKTSLLLLALSLALSSGAAQPAFRVGGYLPGPGSGRIDFAELKGLTELFLFSAVTEADGRLDTAWLDRAPWEELRAFSEREGTRLILCVGGWERSEHFAAMAARPESRAAFVCNALDYCDAHGLQGIDLDWEFPKDAREERDYGLLLRELRRAFEPRGWSVFLTIAPEQNPTAAAIAAADFVQIMSYDRGVRHATFEAAEKNVAKLLEAGVPASKLVLGLPFYGRRIADRIQAKSYRDILRDYSPPPAADEAGGYYFNGQDMISRKTRFALEKGLAGVMFWQLAQDAPGERSLLGAILEAVSD